MSRLGGTIAVLLVAPMVLTGSLHATDLRSNSCDSYLRETPPKFRIAQQDRNESRRAVILQISLAPRDITQDKLLTLSCSLGRTYAKNQTLNVLILDSYRAAKRFNFQGEGNDNKTALSFRAIYGFSREDDDQSLTWWPIRGNDESTVKIKLGSPPPVPSP
jgi:hypothetical protein